MIGNNELVLNHATMIQALQMWLDAKMTEAPYVTEVQAASDNTFVVKVTDKKQPK